MPRRRAGFTIVELLVVISVVALLLSITMPQLAQARESARRLKCIANLKGIGVGFSLYLNDSKGILPRVAPLHDDQDDPEDPSLLELLSDYVGVDAPIKDEQGLFVVGDPYRCPSDVTGTDEATDFEPLYRTDGTSYEYFAGGLMLLTEFVFPWVTDTAFPVTKAYEADHPWPLVIDAQVDPPWHKGRGLGAGQNALYYPDMRADWFIVPTDKEMEDFFEDVAIAAGTPPGG